VGGLHSRLVGEDKKSRAAYEWFFTTAKWDEDELAQRKAELFYQLMGIKPGDRLLLIVDDTLNEKKGKATEGVGYFMDHSTGKYVWGELLRRLRSAEQGACSCPAQGKGCTLERRTPGDWARGS